MTDVLLILLVACVFWAVGAFALCLSTASIKLWWDDGSMARRQVRCILWPLVVVDNIARFLFHIPKEPLLCIVIYFAACVCIACAQQGPIAPPQQPAIVYVPAPAYVQPAIAWHVTYHYGPLGICIWPRWVGTPVVPQQAQPQAPQYQQAPLPAPAR